MFTTAGGLERIGVSCEPPLASWCNDPVMGDRLRDTMDGTLGHFWMNFADVYNLDKADDGHVRLADDDLFHIGTLRTRKFNNGFGTSRERLPMPDAIYAMTNVTRSIFFRHRGRLSVERDGGNEPRPRPCGHAV